MLELKEYTRAEIVQMFGNSDNQNLERKLERYGVSLITSGNGDNRTFKVMSIESRFKLFCLTELGFDARSDFNKASCFYYHYLNDEVFSAMPNSRKEEMMNSWEVSVSRTTISNYIQKLADKDFILSADRSLNYEDYICYFVNDDFIKTANWGDYSKAWRDFYSDLQKGISRKKAYAKMKENYGGIGKRGFIPRQVAWYSDKLNELNDYAIEELNKIKSDY